MIFKTFLPTPRAKVCRTRLRLSWSKISTPWLLAGCNGADLTEINTDDVTLVAAVMTASGSMSGNRQAVLDGFNTMLDSFNGSKQADSILVSAWSFNEFSRLHFSYTPAPSVSKMTWGDYDPDGGTGLYDTILNVMAGMIAYGQTLRNSGVRTRGIIVVFSDGGDNTSNAKAYQVKTVSDSMMAQEIYTLAYGRVWCSRPDPVSRRGRFPRQSSRRAAARPKSGASSGRSARRLSGPARLLSERVTPSSRCSGPPPLS